MSCRFKTVWLIRLSSTINTCSVPLSSIGVPTVVLREDDRLMGTEGEGQEPDMDLRGEEDSMRAAMAEGGATARVLMKNRKTLREEGDEFQQCGQWITGQR